MHAIISQKIPALPGIPVILVISFEPSWLTFALSESAMEPGLDPGREEARDPGLDRDRVFLDRTEAMPAQPGLVSNSILFC